MPSSQVRITAKATTSINYTLYYGTFIHTPTLDNLEICFNTLVGVNDQGIIDFMHKNYNPNEHNGKSPIDFFIENHHDYHHHHRRYGRHFEYVDISEEMGVKFFFPGFIDTHIHASQFPNIGIGLDTPLLDWLNNYTFALENQFTDLNSNRRKLEFANLVYSKVISRTLNNGTTCASYFTTIDSQTTNLFGQLLLELGQRGFVGKVCMDDNATFNKYQETYEECIESMDAIISHLSVLNPESEILVQPIVTPRFAPVCTRELLKYLGNLSEVNKIPIQTHISENVDEIKLVEHLFPECPNYASVYDSHGLLKQSTILAHAIHLNDEERKLIKRKHCSISHCPTSNTFLSSGEAPIKQYLTRDKINVSLGTDVSGGFDSSILGVIKHSILVSHHLSMKTNNPKDKLTLSDALYMSTMGGAKAMGLQDMIGSFEMGKKFDVQLIDLSIHTSNVDVFNWQYINEEEGDKKMVDLLGKWVFSGDDRNCTKVWCNGRLVVDKKASGHRDDRWVMI
ncbi:hypothetical protein JA1_003125 [Spathaspora sp. JA1]|nr:hypothetical protein JA1_003125 [Spathaspora sp. JA1]